MSDVADRAQSEVDLFTERSLSGSKRVEPVFSGFCAFCDDPCAGKFCDSDCLSDWEREQKMKKIRGSE